MESKEGIYMFMFQTTNNSKRLLFPIKENLKLKLISLSADAIVPTMLILIVFTQPVDLSQLWLRRTFITPVISAEK